MPNSNLTKPADWIERKIHDIRGLRVILDSDLAEIYGVSTKRLNEQVKRSKDRFPEDFMFQLTNQELSVLRSQNATSRSPWGGRRTTPKAFTEHGTIMVANVLSSPKAVHASIEVVRAFVRLRVWMMGQQELARKLNQLEKKYDTQFRTVFDAIRELMSPPRKKKHRIGFRHK